MRYYSSHNLNVSPTVISVTLNNIIKVFLRSLQKQMKNTHMDFFFPLNQAVKAPEHEIKDESEQPFKCL